MNTQQPTASPQRRHAMVITPRGRTILALYGDQTVTEVWNLQLGEVIGRHRTRKGESTARPWIPMELADLARSLAPHRAGTHWPVVLLPAVRGRFGICTQPVAAGFHYLPLPWGPRGSGCTCRGADDLCGWCQHMGN